MNLPFITQACAILPVHCPHSIHEMTVTTDALTEKPPLQWSLLGSLMKTLDCAEWSAAR